MQEKSKLVALQSKLEQLFRAGLAGGHYDNGAEASSDTEEVNSIFHFCWENCGKIYYWAGQSNHAKEKSLIRYCG